MLGYFEYLNIPTRVAVVLAILFLIVQMIGELLEFRGKIVPEILKVRKYFQRKKRERDVLARMPEMIEKIDGMPHIMDTLTEVKTLLSEVNRHYSADNIAMRNDWMKDVNKNSADTKHWLEELSRKLDQNISDVLKMRIDNMRSAIIDFAAYVANENNPVTKEQYRRIFKLHEEYERTIAEYGLTNGEVTIAYRMIAESYERHLCNRSFVEDVRGYDNVI